MQKNERWVDVRGFEGFYQVSDLGRVKSLDRKIQTAKGLRFYKGRILKPGKRAYLFVHMRNKDYGTVRDIHRLVALAFIPNHENKPEVNHKDGNKYNNNADNLEWVTKSENMLHNIKMFGNPRDYVEMGRRGYAAGLSKISKQRRSMISKKAIASVHARRTPEERSYYAGIAGKAGGRRRMAMMTADERKALAQVALAARRAKKRKES